MFILTIVLLFIIGVIFGSIFTNIGYRLPIDENLLSNSKCDNCNHVLKLSEKIPIISYIIQKGRCNYCNQKISFIYIIFEILSGLLFSATYLTFMDSNFPFLTISLGLIFVSTLLIVMVSDIKYMLIPNELLIVSGSILLVLKIYLLYLNEEIVTLLDMGYEILFILLDAFIMFVIMFVIKKIGDIIFKKESLGGGDIKLMTFIAIIMGYKMSIVVIFLASFIALPFSIINAYKKDQVMLPFGPYLAIATIILFLCNVSFDMVLDFIH